MVAFSTVFDTTQQSHRSVVFDGVVKNHGVQIFDSYPAINRSENGKFSNVNSANYAQVIAMQQSRRKANR